MKTLVVPDKQPFSLYLERDASKIAKERAGYKCERCSGVGPFRTPTRRNPGHALVLVHHKFPIGNLPRSANLFNHPSNLEVLCPSCHAKEHHNGHHKNRVEIQLKVSRLCDWPDGRIE